MGIFDKIGETVAKVKKANADRAADAAVARKKRDEAELAKEYFSIWRKTGLVHGVRKWKEQHGDYIYPYVEFYLRDPKGQDDHNKFNRIDFPITDGQQATVVMAGPKGRNTWVVRVYNHSMNKYYDIKGGMDQALKGSGSNSTRLYYELDRYVKERWK